MSEEKIEIIKYEDVPEISPLPIKSKYTSKKWYRNAMKTPLLRKEVNEDELVVFVILFFLAFIRWFPWILDFLK